MAQRTSASVETMICASLMLTAGVGTVPLAVAVVAVAPCCDAQGGATLAARPCAELVATILEPRV